VTNTWRFYSCGLDGLVVEWDLCHLKPISVTSSLGGAIWAIAAQPLPSPADSLPSEPYVAVASDDGGIRLLTPDAGTAGLHYRRTIGHASARALCVAWRSDAAIVYAGFSDGCIRALDVASGA
jgi:WD40 repeat protein